MRTSQKLDPLGSSLHALIRALLTVILMNQLHATTLHHTFKTFQLSDNRL